MKKYFKLKKGLDLHLVGTAAEQVQKLAPAALYALRPSDFVGVVPKPTVRPGDHIMAGQPLFVDKASEQINFASPVSGTIKEVRRGDRRKILAITVQPDGAQEYKDFGKVNVEKADAEAMTALLLRSGIFGYIRQRPYDVVASPKDKPRDIFVSTFSKMPLAAKFRVVSAGREEYFKTGLRALSRIAPVHLGICPEQINTALLPVEEVEVCVFDGPNPAGNVGVQINHVAPVNKGDVVWTLGAEMVCVLGELIQTGELHLTRRIAVAGSKVKEPQYVETPIGTPLSHILSGQLESTEHVRIINGNPLVGEKSLIEDFLGAFQTEVCCLPEGDDADELFGWIRPRLDTHSTSLSYCSWLLGRGKAYDTDCRIKGSERHMIMSAEYERVFPMDILPSYLMKAIITGDIDQQEALGIYEVAPEDFAVAEYIDSSKLELQRLVREGLDTLKKENA